MLVHGITTRYFFVVTPVQLRSDGYVAVFIL